MTGDPASPDAKEQNGGEAAAGASAPPAARSAGARRVWEKFRRARGARWGLRLVVLFSLVAFLAPFLAHRMPFVWQDAGGEWSFPLVREFFAPSDTTEPVLERGINFLFVFLPAAFLAWGLMNRRLPGLARVRSRGIALLFGILAAAALWLAVGGMVVDGGGDDWVRYETPPVPEMDDILDPGRAEHGPLAERLVRNGFLPRPDATPDQRRRALIAPLQRLVEGERLPAGGLEGFVPPVPAGRGGGDAGAAEELERARWNRSVVEAALPGLLPPMRRTRISFLTLAAISALTLLGLTYVCLAGAWQFSLSPRWLVLLALAAALSLLFRGAARHDLTPFRQLAAEGKGRGVFPPLPYGPNEQGFGPRLPPSWATPPALLDGGDVAAWDLFAAALDAPSSPAAERVAAALDAELPGWRELARDGAGDAAGRAAVVAALNRVLGKDGLADDAVRAALRADGGLRPYFAALRAGTLDAARRERMNRLILDRALPGAVRPAVATRWKNPGQLPGTHLLGTDESGRDVLVRIIHGARVSLSVGFVSVFLATVIGLVAGSLAAYYGGKVDMLISRFLEIMMCFPSFFLILAVIAVLDRRSIVNIMLVIGLTSWTGVARLIRGEMLRQKKMDYVAASVALGASDTRTIFRHILPNAMAPVLVSVSFGITGAILTEAGLSFIGFGVTPPTPTWGQLLSEGRESPLGNWWQAVFPGVVLFASVLAYNMVGEGLRDALDPRSE